MFPALLLAILGIGFAQSRIDTAHLDPFSNKLRFSYGTLFKFNGHVQQNLDRVWVVTTVPIPKFKDLTFADPMFDPECKFFENFLVAARNASQSPAHHHYSARQKCALMKSRYLSLVQRQESLKSQLRSVMQDNLYKALPGLGPRPEREKRGLFALATGAVGLVTIGVEMLNSWLTNKRVVATEKAVRKMHYESEMAHNRIMQLEDDFLMYGTYTLNSTEGIIETINSMQHVSDDLGSALAGQINPKSGHVEFPWFLMDTILQEYFVFLEEKHINLYSQLLDNYKTLMVAIAKLSKGYLPPEIFSLGELHGMIEEVRTMLRTHHQAYTLALPGIQHYYDMKLVTFQLDPSTHSLVVTFPILIKEHNQAKMALYEIETVHVPVLDKDPKRDSYTRVQITKPYIAINSEFYTQLRIQELRMCKRIGYEFYCEEMFVVKHMSVPSCASALFFNLPYWKIRPVCHFKFSYNETVLPSVLDGGEQIVLANFRKSKKIICTDNLNLAAPLPTHHYALINRSSLCNCQIQSGHVYLLSRLGACSSALQPRTMHFTVNMGFQIHLAREFNITLPDHPTNLTDEEFAYPFSLTPVRNIKTLRTPQSVKELMTTMKQRRRILSQLTPKEASFGWDSISSNEFAVNDSDIVQIIKNSVAEVDEDQENENIFGMNFARGTKHKIWQVIIWSIGGLVIICSAAIGMMACRYCSLSAIVMAMNAQVPTAEASMNIPEIKDPIEMLPQLATVVCEQTWLSKFLMAMGILGACVTLYSIIACICKRCRQIHPAEQCTLVVLLTKGHTWVEIPLLVFKGDYTSCRINGHFDIGNLDYSSHCCSDVIHINWEGVHIEYQKRPMPMPASIALSCTERLWLWKLRRLNSSPFEVTIIAKQGTGHMHCLTSTYKLKQKYLNKLLYKMRKFQKDAAYAKEVILKEYNEKTKQSIGQKKANQNAQSSSDSSPGMPREERWRRLDEMGADLVAIETIDSAMESDSDLETVIMKNEIKKAKNKKSSKPKTSDVKEDRSCFSPTTSPKPQSKKPTTPKASTSKASQERKEQYDKYRVQYEKDKALLKAPYPLSPREQQRAQRVAKYTQIGEDFYMGEDPVLDMLYGNQ